MKKLYLNMSMTNGDMHGVAIYSIKLKEILEKKLTFNNVIPVALYIKKFPYLSIYRIFWNTFILPLLTYNCHVYSFSSHGSIFKKNQIITIHDLICFEFPEQHKLQYLYFKYYVPLLIKSSKKIVVISEFTKKEVIKHYNIPNHKIETIYNGLNNLIYTYDRNDEAEYVKCTENKPYFISVGASYSHKNIERLLESISNLNDINCNFIIISKKNDYGLGLRKKAQEINLRNVIFLENVSFGLLAKLYQNALANIYISLYEGFGFPPLEAASLNTVSIVSDIPIMREVLDSHAIYVDPTSVEDITAKILEVYENKINVDDLTKNFPILLDKYSWDKTAEQIKKLILESV